MITKIIVFVLIFAILFLLKEGFNLYVALTKTGTLDMPNKRLLSIGLALSYILTIIFTGIGF